MGTTHISTFLNTLNRPTLAYSSLHEGGVIKNPNTFDFMPNFKTPISKFLFLVRLFNLSRDHNFDS